MGTKLICGELLVVLFRQTDSRLARTAAALAAVAVILATGFGRVVARAHWPSDAAGGWLFGARLLGAVVWVRRSRFA